MEFRKFSLSRRGLCAVLNFNQAPFPIELLQSFYKIRFLTEQETAFPCFKLENTSLFSHIEDARRGDRAAECTALEMLRTRKRTEGSNPSLSARSVGNGIYRFLQSLTTSEKFSSGTLLLFRTVPPVLIKTVPNQYLPSVRRFRFPFSSF